MAIVRSFGALQPVTGRSYSSGASTGVALYSGHAQSYAQLYRSQPNVRTVVDFLAMSVGQTSLQQFRRVSDVDRVRLADHELAIWLREPIAPPTRYRLFESLMQDFGIYFSAYWLKVRADERIGLLRLPPEQVRAEGGLLPEVFIWRNPNGDETEFAPSDVVHFGGYDPSDNVRSVSPLETLRRILAEEAAAGEYRAQYWANAGRFEGVIERAATQKEWTDEQGRTWRRQWQEQRAGNGHAAGTVSVLSPGMVFKQTSFSAKDAEYLSARKLTREECAAAYHVPLPMVGILEHATFSNIVEQHKQLYQDCLGPWHTRIAQEIDRQLLVECADRDRVYSEFNIAEKLKGNFEEQGAVLQALVGKPVMTPNEARARLNLPRDSSPDSDRIAPQQGGPAAPPPTASSTTDNKALVPQAFPHINPDEAVAVVLRSTWHRHKSRLAKLPASDQAAAFAAARPRWLTEVCTDLTPLIGEHAAAAYASTSAAHVHQMLLKEGAGDA